MTIEEAEKIVAQSLKDVRAGSKYHSDEWNQGFQAAFEWTEKRLEGFKELYILKKTDIKPEPVKPVPFKVGQTLRRTSDGLKCIIHKDWFGCICLVQLNDGHQFATETDLGPSNDVTPEVLSKISGGYTFVTETKGREMGLPWAKEEQKRENQSFLDKLGANFGMNQKEFGGGTYSQH